MRRYAKKLGMIFGISLLLAGTMVVENKAGELKDVNPERLETVYGMDEEGNIFEIDGSPAIVVTEDAEVALTGEDTNEMDTAARAVTPKVVNFNTKGSSSTTSYKEYSTGASGYTNGAYGADAAYLGKENGYVIFMLSGVIGKVDADEVQVVDFEDVKNVSYYEVEDGKLKHWIAHKVTETSRSGLINGKAPSYLKEGKKYYSYDGHYFYKNYAVMLEDYRNDTRENSENPENPHFNYYQFLPMRSRTEYTADELYNLINAKVADSSKMKNKGRYFVQYQNTYGVNGLIIAGIGANESAWGLSNICNSKNNLFGINAVDSSPGSSANTFSSIQDCIKQFSETYMSKRYLRPGYTYYHGGYLGNKASGINVSYASDPYWGEKAANVAYTLNQNGGDKDYGTYTIGVVNKIAKMSKKPTSVNVRSGNSAKTTKLYTTGNLFGYSVLLQKAEADENFYKIQSDGVLNSERTEVDSSTGKYNFGKMYAYISADYVDVVHEGQDVKITSLATPENVSAAYKNKAVTFAWKKVANAKGYYIYRKADGGSFSRIGVVDSGDTLKYKDDTVIAGTKYTYTVRAYHKSIWSSYNSTGVSVTIPEDETTYTDYVTTADVNYRSGAGTGYAKKGTLSEGTVISVEDGYSKKTENYTWVRFKLNGKKYYVASEYLKKAVTLSKPALVSVKHSNGTVTFKWKKVANAKGYYIYRKVKGGSYKKIATVKSGTTVTYKDKNVTKGKTYIYTVKAYNGSNVSGYKTAGLSISIPKTYTKYKTTTAVNYRNGAGTSFAKKGNLAKGKVISVEDGYSKKADGYTWVRFKLNGKNYYVAKKYLKKA